MMSGHFVPNNFLRGMYSRYYLYTGLIGPQSYSSVLAEMMSTPVTNLISVLVD
jgi:hypothetical protein